MGHSDKVFFTVYRMNKLILLLCLVHPAFQGQLFDLKPDVDTSDIKACNDAEAISCVVAEVDVSGLQDGSLDLPQDLQDCSMDIKNEIQKPMIRSGRADQAKSTAYEANCGDAVVSVRDGKVMATINLEDGRIFVLEPCKAFPGCHVLKEEAGYKDEEGKIPEGPAVRNIFSERNADDLRQQGIDDSTTVVTFSVKYYYTLDFEEVTDDIDLYFDQLIAETNQGYINSEIPVRIEIFCIEATTLRDIQDGGQMLDTFANMKGSSAALRGSADAAALIVKDFSYCGIGYLDTWRSGLTVTAQTKGCALGYFTMGHELGHNFGCMHDREHSSSAPYAYAYGHYIGPAYLEGSGYRTCMAYGKAGYGRKANYFSNPNVSFKGHVTGTEDDNNARVIRENRFGMAAVGDESGTCDWVAPTTTTIATTTATTTFTTTVSKTTMPPTASTTTTTFTNVTVPFLECAVDGIGYKGIRIDHAKKRARNWKRCMKRCRKTPLCEHYTYYYKQGNSKKLRKKCFLWETVTEVFETDNATSGYPDSCP